MKLFYHFLLAGVFSLITFLQVYSQTTQNANTAGDSDAHCANDDDSPGGDCDCDKCAGPNSFDAYTGNQHREILDLQVWGGVGEMPLEWRRYGNSRFDFAKGPFGSAYYWSGSFIFRMYDVGISPSGQPQLAIILPDGEKNQFTRNTLDNTLWIPPPSVPTRLFQKDDTTFFLQTGEGYRYRFVKRTNNIGNYYLLLDFKDPYQNLYTLNYDSGNRLIKVTEPAGRYLEITYELINKEMAITRVKSFDGRSVGYHYKVINDGLVSWVALDTVYYGDGTKAIYEYSQSEPGVKPNLSHAIDPRVIGSDGNMMYTYDNTIAVGFIHEERNGVTNEVMATLDGGPEHNIVCYANGKMETFYFPGNRKGHLNSHTDGMGRVTKFEYDSNGLGFLNKEVDALGRITLYNKKTIYNNPLEITYPDGSKEKWTRDKLDLILTHTDELGRITTSTRDASHRVTKISYPDGTSESFTYNAFGQVLTHTLRNKGVEKYAYNNRGLKTSFTDAIGNKTQYSYDPSDRLASIIDARGNIIKYEYNERGLLTKIINADNTSVSYLYDAFGNRTKTTDELKHSITTTYDEFKRPLTVTDALSRVTRYQYDLPGGVCGCSHAENTPTKIILPSGKVTEIEYDIEWQKIRETVGSGTAEAATTLFEYDLVKRLVSIIDPNGKEWKTLYDPRDRKTAAIDPLGNRTDWQYDAVGNVVKIIRPDGGATVNQYDVMDRLIKTTDPKGQIILMAYDAEGNMNKLTDPKNKAYQFTYDLLNRKTKMIYPDGSSESYSYDVVSNLITYTTKAGQKRIYEYDKRNREIKSSWASPDLTPAISKTYDAAGRLLTITSSVSALTYTYNVGDELTSETQTVTGGGSGKKVSYSYNKDGLRHNMTYPNGTVLNYTYTSRNQELAILNGIKKITSYSYDLNGNRTGKTLQNGTNANYTYDAANNMLSLDNRKGSTSFARFDYKYDNMDRRKSMKRDNSKGDVYAYDAIDQVTKVQYEATNPEGTPMSPVRTVSYDWDSSGNRTVVTDNSTPTSYTTNNMNQYTKVGSLVPTYDNNANLNTFNDWTYTYDAQNRMTKAVKGSTTATFSYDARNRCVQRTINGVSTFFYYDEWNLIEERNSSSALLTSYVHGAQLDELLLKASVSGSVKDTVLYHYDALGSATQLTNTVGNVVEQYSYDVFGAPTIKDRAGTPLAVSAYRNRFLFTGREYIQEVDLYDYRNRMYLDSLGRFLQSDPLRFEAGDKNIYRYVLNSVTNSIDPLGLGILDGCSPVGSTKTTTVECPCCPPKGGTGHCTYNWECVSVRWWVVGGGLFALLYYPGYWELVSIDPPTDCS